MAIYLLCLLSEKKGKGGGGHIKEGIPSERRGRGNVSLHYAPYVIFMQECVKEFLVCT